MIFATKNGTSIRKRIHLLSQEMQQIISDPRIQNPPIVPSFFPRPLDTFSQPHQYHSHLFSKMGTPLHVACLNNQYTKVKTLLSTESLRGEERTREGFTALTLCSKLNNVHLVRLLLENKARLNAVDKVGATALIISSKQGNLQVVNVLVKAGADLEVEVFFFFLKSALYLAAEQERLEVVGPLMRAGSNPCSSREGGMTPLHTAARHGRLGVVQALVGGGALLSTNVSR